MMPLKLFRSRNFTGANLLTLFLYAALAGTLFFLPLNLIQVQGIRRRRPARHSAVHSDHVWSVALVGRTGEALRFASAAGDWADDCRMDSRFSSDRAPAPVIGQDFFPAIVVLGVGMAISVAPLTTTVMNSVKSSHAGIASGVNNAVSRTAGLLAIAVFGLIMFHVFNGCLDRRLEQIPLAPDIRQALNQQRTRLAAIEIPANVTEGTRSALAQAIDECFVNGFQRVMLTGAALAFVSSLTAWITIRED